MEEGDLGFCEKEMEYLLSNFSYEERRYWYVNGCWDKNCKGDCIDPTCSIKIQKYFQFCDSGHCN